MPEPWALGDYHLRLTVVCFCFDLLFSLITTITYVLDFLCHF
jgi:hypothetical protein